jgi:hypothetical protein
MGLSLPMFKGFRNILLLWDTLHLLRACEDSIGSN